MKTMMIINFNSTSLNKYTEIILNKLLNTSSHLKNKQTRCFWGFLQNEEKL